MPKQELEKNGLKSGRHAPYQWLTSTEQYVGTLVEICPEAVLGRYLAVTSTDSGDAWLTDKQRLAGWQLRSGIAYSPLLTTRSELIYQRDGLDVPGYDEWYLFETKGPDLGEPIKENFFEPINAPRPGHLLVFVNQLGFTIDPNPGPSVLRGDVLATAGMDQTRVLCFGRARSIDVFDQERYFI